MASLKRVSMMLVWFALGVGDDVWSEDSAKARQVMVSRGPGQPWFPMKTRVLADLPEIPPDQVTTRFGGIAPEGGPLPASGFFRTIRRDGRWWLVDPEGNLFIHRGVVSVKPSRTQGGLRAQERLYGSPENWAAETVKLLRRNGFNGTGAWTDDAALQAKGGGLVYTPLWSFMSAYGPMPLRVRDNDAFC